MISTLTFLDTLKNLDQSRVRTLNFFVEFPLKACLLSRKLRKEKPLLAILKSKKKN